jgi:hypothetical protein
MATDPMLCAVWRCGMHFRANAWLEQGDLATLREWLPAIEQARVKTWARCTCALYDRIVAALA